MVKLDFNQIKKISAFTHGLIRAVYIPLALLMGDEIIKDEYLLANLGDRIVQS